MKKRIRVLLEHNGNYKDTFDLPRNHMNFPLYQDFEIGFPSELYDNQIHDSV